MDPAKPAKPAKCYRVSGLLSLKIASGSFGNELLYFCAVYTHVKNMHIPIIYQWPECVSADYIGI